VSDSDHGIFENLRGTVCACSSTKKAGKSFCVTHYFQLPKALRNALYSSNGYVESYRAALQYLGLAEPKTQPARGGRFQEFAPKQYRARTGRDHDFE
jgi:hypothetical protein